MQDKFKVKGYIEMLEKLMKFKSLKHYMIPIIMLVIACAFILNQILLPPNVTSVSKDDLSKHIIELTSSNYAGRQAGSPGNELAIDYIVNYFNEYNLSYGIDEQSYLQPFQAVVPYYDPFSSFVVNAPTQTISLDMFSDYNLYAHSSGKSLIHEGRMIFAGTELHNMDPKYIENSLIIVTKGYILPEDIDYVLKNKGKGLLVVQMTSMLSFSAESQLLPKTKSLSTFSKSEKLLPIGHFKKSTYANLIAHADQVIPIQATKSEMYIFNHVKIDSEIAFPVINTANVIGKINGSNKNGKHLILSTNIDGLGKGANNQYFPGASKNATGIATLLEIANNLSKKTNVPYETIYFAFWNNEASNLAGSTYYINHPASSLEKAMHIQIDQFGTSSSAQIKLYSRTDLGNMLRSILMQHSQNQNQDVVLANMPINSSQLAFATSNVPSVSIHNKIPLTDTYDDTIDSIDFDTVQSIANILQSYIISEIYQENHITYVPSFAQLIILVLYILALLIQFILSLYNHMPNYTYRNISIEKIYFSNWFTFIKRIFFTFTISITLLLIIIFIGFLPEDTSIFHRGNAYYSNISPYLMIKRTLTYIVNFFQFGFGETLNHASIWSIISKASLRSFSLIFSSLCLSFILGLVKGTFDHYRISKKSHSSILMILTASIPDVLIVLIGILAIIYGTKFQIPLLSHSIMKKQGIPLLCLTLLPYLYVSKTTYIFIKDELDKMYIQNAKARGLSRMQIFIKHLLPTAFYKNLDMIPTLFALITANLIIVEYLFDYKGIIYFLIYFQQLGDSPTFIGLSISLALIYVLINVLAKILAYFVNPMKKEGL